MSTRKQKNRIRIILMIVSCFLFAIGYYLFDVVSRWYKVPLGVTFHVVTGCTLMAVSTIYFCYAINKIFFTKRKKRSSKPVFLDDESKNSSLD
ncbi:MAG TPA: cytochrome b/b6 domain-containing protein [Flavobacterium sp.]